MQTDIDTVTREYYQRVNMTHAQQLESFGWCICEGGQGHISEGCPLTCDICQENLATYTGVMTIKGELALCESCHND